MQGRSNMSEHNSQCRREVQSCGSLASREPKLQDLCGEQITHELADTPTIVLVQQSFYCLVTLQEDDTANTLLESSQYGS